MRAHLSTQQIQRTQQQLLHAQGRKVIEDLTLLAQQVGDLESEVGELQQTVSDHGASLQSHDGQLAYQSALLATQADELADLKARVEALEGP